MQGLLKFLPVLEGQRVDNRGRLEGSYGRVVYRVHTGEFEKGKGQELHPALQPPGAFVGTDNDRGSQEPQVVSVIVHGFLVFVFVDPDDFGPDPFVQFDPDPEFQLLGSRGRGAAASVRLFVGCR